VAIDEMASPGPDDGNEDVPPPWHFFVDVDKRHAYDAWINKTSPDRQPRVVPLRPKREE
jgi:hypothetical protein